MKKWLIVITILSLMMSMVACAKKDSKEPISTTEDVQKEEFTTTETTTEAVAEPLSYEKEIIGGTKIIAPGENGLVNSAFEGDLSNWELVQSEGAVETTLPGNQQLKLTWSKADDETGIILKQTGLTLEQSKNYSVTFDAQAKLPSSLQVIVKSEKDSALVYADQTFEISDKMSNFTFDFMMNEPLDSKVTFEIHWVENPSGQEVTLSNLSLIRTIGDLVWSEEFDYTGLPDPDKWAGDVGGNGWGNGELQYYTGVSENNVWVEDGKLTITAKKEEKGGNHYTSARLTTLSKAKWAFGRIEVNAKLPEGIGTWPAIWMLSTGNKYGNWPGSGEIDIMENVGYDMDNIHASFHSGTYNWRGSKGQKTSTILAKNAAHQNYTYTLEWTPTQMDVYVDDHLYITYENEGTGFASWPFDETFYLILNIAIGGGWGGQQGIDDTIFPQTMEVDYVRVYDLGIDLTDYEAPQPVEELTYELKEATLNLKWKSTYDNYGIKSYEVYMDGALLGTNKVREFMIQDFDKTQKHTFEVYALDGAGNKSEPTELVYSE